MLFFMRDVHLFELLFSASAFAAFGGLLVLFSTVLLCGPLSLMVCWPVAVYLQWEWLRISWGFGGCYSLFFRSCWQYGSFRV